MATKTTKFGEYLTKKKLAADDVAKELGVTRSYVHALAAGTMTPGLRLAVQIQTWSKNAIMPASWLE